MRKRFGRGGLCGPWRARWDNQFEGTVAGKQEETGKVLRICGESLVFLEVESEAGGGGRGCLGSGVGDDVGFRWKEGRFGFFLAGYDGETEAGVCGDETDIEICRRSLRKSVGKPRPDLLIGLRGLASLPDGATEIEYGFLRNAASAADQPADIRGEIRSMRRVSAKAGARRTWLHLNVKWEHNFVFIAKVHQRAERKPFGDGKLERTRLSPLRGGPLDLRRLASVSRILPVDVPAGFEFEVKAYPVRAVVKLRVRSNELNVHVGEICGTGGCEERKRRCERDRESDDGTQESH